MYVDSKNTEKQPVNNAGTRQTWENQTATLAKQKWEVFAAVSGSGRCGY